MTRPLLIGQAPGANTSPDLPLYPLPLTSTGGRLMGLMGITDRVEYLQRFERINLLHEFPGRHRRDDKFPKRLARVAAQAVRPLLVDREVVLIGRNVGEAFGYAELAFHEWLGNVDTFRKLAVVPHPSGRNHWYNRPGRREEAAAFWSAFLRPDENSS